MHNQLMKWLTRTKAAHPYAFRGRRVLECGSLDINGTPRVLFDNGEYIGIDWRPGPGVDEVCLIHQAFLGQQERFETVISTETLEHDPYWRDSVTRMIELLTLGGALILSSAAPGRLGHQIEASPVDGYYCNLDLVDLLAHIFRQARFRYVSAVWDQGPHDIYVFCDGKL